LPWAALGCSNLVCGRHLNLDPAFAGPDDARWGYWNASPAFCQVPSTIETATGATSNLLDLSGSGCDAMMFFLWGEKPNLARLCQANRGDQACTSIHLAAKPREVALGPGARLAALVVGTPGAFAIETWDLQTHQRLGRFPAGTTAQRPCARVAMLDDRVVVDPGACEDVAWLSDQAYLATPQGKRIAALGGARPVATVRRLPIAVGGHRWAFVAARGDTVVVQNVATGAVERTIATHAQVEPGMVIAGGDDHGHVVLRFGGTTALAGGTVVVDANTGDVRTIAPLPHCPAHVIDP
jgi:hypothetical protein